MISNFFCLVSKELLPDNSKVDNYDCNLLNGTYDIKFGFYTSSEVIRNIEGTGKVYSDEKFKIKLTGKGSLKNFEEKELKFFSSELLTQSSCNRQFLFTFEKMDGFYNQFEQYWLKFFKKIDITEDQNKNESLNIKFGVPILNVLLLSKVIKSNSWSLEFIEK